MTNLKRIIEVDCKTAKSIKGGDSAACNCNCVTSCECLAWRGDTFSAQDSQSNRQRYTSMTSGRFK